MLIKIGNLLPYLVSAGAFVAMLISVLLRYNERFHEFWAGHVCAFMEEHDPNVNAVGQTPIDEFLEDGYTPTIERKESF